MDRQLIEKNMDINKKRQRYPTKDEENDYSYKIMKACPFSLDIKRYWGRDRCDADYELEDRLFDQLNNYFAFGTKPCDIENL